MPNKQIHVLLIEDDQDDYFLARELFSELPPGAYHLDRVATYDDAIHAFDNCVHDVYLVDYHLGSRNGLELLGEAIVRGCVAPMIMLTGQHEPDVDRRAMQAGAVDYLIKGQFDAAELERTMRYAIRQKQHELDIRQANMKLEERVSERTAELAKVNDSLQLEITERKRVAEALREADRLKDEFLATLAHELRNPLASISSAVQLLGIEPVPPVEMERLQVMMMRQVRQLVRLIDDLLDVSRISQGKIQLHQEVFPLTEIIDAALDTTRPFVEASAHELRLDLPQESIQLEGDKVRLTQVLSNLLVNAAKYTPRGGKLDLQVRREGKQLLMTVRDNGVGVPAEMLSQIFGLFTQVDSSKTRAHGGLGIGLTLVKTLVEMHGGTVSAKSEGLGKGSEFSITLPTSIRIPPAPVPPQADVITLDSIRARHVLVVDDDRSGGTLLGRLLERLGQKVRMAPSASVALEILPQFEPQIVISDIGMPGMTGYDLARKIRQDTSIKQPILVALTGYGQESDRMEATAAGFDLHLTKPVALADLQKLLSDPKISPA